MTIYTQTEERIRELVPDNGLKFIQDSYLSLRENGLSMYSQEEVDKKVEQLIKFTNNPKKQYNSFGI